MKTTDNPGKCRNISRTGGSFYPDPKLLDGSPFALQNEEKYQAWRQEKLSHLPMKPDALLVQINRLDRITPEEKSAILARCKKYNMVIYHLNHLPCEAVALKGFAANFGLEKLDHHYCNDVGGITALQVSTDNNKGGFIPYSDKALNWHTDGYYNRSDQQVHAVLLHCHRPATEGGENLLMDHEMAYLRLRDENPDFIGALMRVDAMTIPAHIENGKQLRPAQSGPVFSLYGKGQKLHMRYSQRTRNIVWRDDDVTRQAVDFLNRLLTADNPDTHRIKLAKGQGILSNNILHNRSAFHDSKAAPRVIYRGRFFESIGEKS